MHIAYRLQHRPAWVRWAQLLLGLLFYGIAVVLMIRSGLGLGPWDAFHVGLHNVTGVSVGMASIGIGLAIVVAGYYFGVRPGAGTLANMVLIGVFIDLLLPVVPLASGWAWGFLYYAAGILLCGFATGFYIGAGLGKGPRDGAMIGLSQKTGWPVRRVRTLIEVLVLGGGWLMGATIGVGTILFAAAIGPVTQWGLQLFGMTATGAERSAPDVNDEEALPLRDAA